MGQWVCLFGQPLTNFYSIVIVGSWQELRGRHRKRSVVRTTGEKFKKKQNLGKARATLAPKKKIVKGNVKGNNTMTSRQKIQAIKQSYANMTTNEAIKFRGPKPWRNSQGLFGTEYPRNPTRCKHFKWSVSYTFLSIYT